MTRFDSTMVETIVGLYNSGLSSYKIADELFIDPSTVTRLFKRIGVQARPTSVPRNTERDNEIRQLHRKGVSPRALSMRYELSVERIYDVLGKGSIRGKRK